MPAWELDRMFGSEYSTVCSRNLQSRVYVETLSAFPFEKVSFQCFEVSHFLRHSRLTFGMQTHAFTTRSSSFPSFVFQLCSEAILFLLKGDLKMKSSLKYKQPKEKGLILIFLQLLAHKFIFKKFPICFFFFFALGFRT